MNKKTVIIVIVVLMLLVAIVAIVIVSQQKTNAQVANVANTTNSTASSSVSNAGLAFANMISSLGKGKSVEDTSKPPLVLAPTETGTQQPGNIYSQFNF